MRTDLGPFAVVPEWLLEADVSSNAVRVYALLWTYTTAGDNRSAIPRHGTLADRLGWSEKTVSRAIRELVDIGAITVEERRREDGTRASDRHILHVGVPDRSVHSQPDNVVQLVTPDQPDRSGGAKNQNQEPEQEPDNPSPDFETFWSLYPSRNGRKTPKKPARNQWKKLKPEQRSKTIAAAPIYAAETDPRYVKDASRWLRDEVFEDYLTPKEDDARTPEEDGLARL